VPSKKIAVFTGSRAEYGLLYWIMKERHQSAELELQLIVSGPHLSDQFGHTVDFILEDGFEVNERVEILLSSSTEVGVAKSLGLGIIGFADALDRLKLGCVVVLGVRYEAFAIAQAATVMRIPIAHIHGGEITEGAIDEAIRHSTSKMAHLHFTSTEVHRNRVIQLGEDPARVFNVEAPAIENVRRSELLSKKELEKSPDFSLGGSSLLVTCHPVTLQKDSERDSLKQLLRVLEKRIVSHQIIMTFPNSDAHGLELIALLQDFAAKYPTKTISKDKIHLVTKRMVGGLGQRSRVRIPPSGLRPTMLFTTSWVSSLNESFGNPKTYLRSLTISSAISIALSMVDLLGLSLQLRNAPL